ncbi:MAG: CHASE domain-containing protein [Drouetiella hepatica Uher 2000/2452]|jgi:signal transduction histidine kinase|uniref:histidine kinase n=1 Tax=Drouetiella hepatica Uher 2000/2452 TaxID=904376 RepID=A0A951Q869_9CYAN|nr:CHASE domain-containing protein [Drouetiella hepatica Uher 2000/2452]
MPKNLLHRQSTLGLILSLGIGLSVLVTSFVSRWEASNRQLRFQRQIENLATALQRSLNRYTDLLAFLSDYYKVEQSPVDRQAFASFVERSLQTYSGIQALEWAPVVPQANRLSYEQTVQSEGYPRFNITELGGDGSLVRAVQRPYYVPVTYVEPFVGNESALGYDLYSNVTRAAAIAQSRDTGSITATGRIRLVQEKRNQFGFLVFQPIYQAQNDQAPALRRQQFTGVLLGVFRISDVVEESLQDLQYEIDFTVYDRSANPAEQFLGRYDAARKQVVASQNQSGQKQSSQNQSSVNGIQPFCPSAESCTQTLTVGQRQWSIVFSPSVGYTGTQYGAIATLMTGLLLTSGLVLFLHQLNRELEQTQSLSNLRFRFFSMASHELRTPLSTILLSSESLQINHNQLTEAQKQTNIQRIHLTAKRMSQQIADLLMLTRAEVGKLEFHPELLDLECFCQQVMEETQLGISQPIQFTNAGQPIKAFLDKNLLRSLLTNLLSNAAKYSSPDAPIQLRLSADLDRAIIQISDRGIGIPAADQPRICDPFYRGSNVGDATGTGLGLAVVKTCVELHRGIWAIESQINEGTTITVRLPLE